MIRAKVAPIPAPYLERLRSEGVDALDQPVKRVVAAGGEPCRDVLRRAKAGEELLLASFSPFEKQGPYREYGPIFVLAHDSGETVERSSIVSGGDHDYLRSQFAIRAYSKDEEIVDATLVDTTNAQTVVDHFFDRAETAFLHVRFPSYGCFAARLDR
jgi:hypothetical protein